MMPTSWWVAAGVGIGIVAVHVGIRLYTRWWARGVERTHTALKAELVGLGVRMLAVLVLTALVLLFVPVPAEPFVVALVGFLLLSIAAEVVLVARHRFDDSSHA
ncbi:MAG: hypothetical protein ACLFTE_03610 [Salinivenus sp.]